MKAPAAVVMIVAILGGACTTTRQVRRPASVADMDAAMPAQRDRVTLLYGPSGEGGSLLDVSNLRGYEVKNRGRGALEGLGLGIVAGALVGAVIGSAGGSDAPCNGQDGCYLSFSAGDKAFAVGAIGALAGGILGPLVGFILGHTNRYVFLDDAAGP